MNVPFNDLEPQSRIWIYQASTKLSADQQAQIIHHTSRFLTEWTAHGHELQAGIQILYDQFIILGVNEAVNEASGCSIDKSVNFIKELGDLLNLNLLERSKIALKQNTEIQLVDFTEIKNLVTQGNITGDTEVFNNAIVSKSDLESNWLKPAKDSWMKRYF